MPVSKSAPDMPSPQSSANPPQPLKSRKAKQPALQRGQKLFGLFGGKRIEYPIKLFWVHRAQFFAEGRTTAVLSKLA